MGQHCYFMGRQVYTMHPMAVHTVMKYKLDHDMRPICKVNYTMHKYIEIQHVWQYTCIYIYVYMQAVDRD